MSALNEIERIGVLPVIVIDDASLAPSLARALAAGGIACGEVTLRTSAGLEAIESMSRVEGFTVVAGTVLNSGDANRAIDAGAHAIVSPGLGEDVISVALERGVDVLPGVSTASEVQRGLRLGLDRFKFFPAEASGGLSAIEALHGPFSNVRFLPSGGVTLTSAASYLKSSAVFAVSGSWMVPRLALDDVDSIRQLAIDTMTRLRP